MLVRTVDFRSLSLPMSTSVPILDAFLRELVLTLYEGGVWILLGFAAAGLLHVLVDPARLARHLGQRSIGACLRAALLGAPIPLCSCGVLPAAMALRKKGASREATLSFLITTPEVGVDSIALTAAYFGPLMALIRPVVAVVTGVVAGALSLRAPDDAAPPSAPGCAVHGAPALAPADDPGCAHDAAAEETGPAPAGGDGAAPSRGVALREKLRRAGRFAFVDLLDDLGFWLAAAVLVTAAVGAVLPPDFFERLLPSSVATMALMVLVAAPLYVCASASTPLAAAFVAKGASAGAALVFLLVGPATNAATLATLRRLVGPRIVTIYLTSIVGVAMAAGMLVDLLLPGLGNEVRAVTAAFPEAASPAKLVGMAGFVVLLGRSLWRTGIRPGLREVAGNARAAWAALCGARPGALLGGAPLRVVLALWLVAVVLDGFVAVPPGAEAVVRRFGVPEGTPRAPGLLFAVPLADRVALVRTAEVRERTVNFSLVPGSLERAPDPDTPLYVTADENLIDVRAAVLFRASDPAAFGLGVEDPEAVLSAVFRAHLLRALALHPIDRLYTDVRGEVEAWLLAEVGAEAVSMRLGIDVVAVRLLDVHAPFLVHEAFRDVASAREDRQTTIHRATEYAAGAVTLARGEAARHLAEAKAWALGRLARAQADAHRFLALAEAHRQAPELTETRLYIETAERVLPGARKIIRSATGAARGYELWLRGNGSRALPPTLAMPASTTPPAPAADPARPRRVEYPILEDEE